MIPLSRTSYMYVYVCILICGQLDDCDLFLKWLVEATSKQR